MKTLGAAKMTTKGQVTVPADARRMFSLQIGDLILFIEKEGELVIKKG